MVSTRVVATTIDVVAVAVPDRDQLAVVLGVLDLDVGQRGQAARAPVDDPLGPVDQPVVEQPLEDGLHGRGTGPSSMVNRSRSQSTQSPSRRIWPRIFAAGLGLPLPDLLDERLPAEVVPGHALLGQLAARPRSGWRCRRGPCPAATAPRSPACGGGGPARPSACDPARGRCAASRSRSAAGSPWRRRARTATRLWRRHASGPPLPSARSGVPPPRWGRTGEGADGGRSRSRPMSLLAPRRLCAH